MDLTNPDGTCIYCSRKHGGKCPLIKRVDYIANPDGTTSISGVEFHGHPAPDDLHRSQGRFPGEEPLRK